VAKQHDNVGFKVRKVATWGGNMVLQSVLVALDFIYWFWLPIFHTNHVRGLSNKERKFQNKGAVLVQIAPLWIRQPRNQSQSIQGGNTGWQQGFYKACLLKWISSKIRGIGTFCHLYMYITIIPFKPILPTVLGSSAGISRAFQALSTMSFALSTNCSEIRSGHGVGQIRETRLDQEY